MKRARKVFFGVLRFAIGGALLAWVLSRGDTLRAVGELFQSAWLLPAAATCMALGAATEAVRLELLFRSQAMRLAWRDGFRVIAIGTFFNFCLPGGTSGDVMKLYYLASGNPGRKVEVLALLFVDRLVALVSVVAVILLLALPNSDLVAQHTALAWLVLAAFAILLGVLLFAALALSARFRAGRLYTGTMNKVPFGGLLRRGMDAIYDFRHHARAFGLALLVSFVGHGFLVALIVATGSVVLPDVPTLALTFLTLLGMLANVLPVTPGGLGVGEAAIDGLFGLAGYAAASPIVVAWRIAQIPLLVLGALYWGLGTKKGAELAVPIERALDAESTRSLAGGPTRELDQEPARELGAERARAIGGADTEPEP